MKTRQIVRWLILIVITGGALYKAKDSVELPSGFGGFLLVLLGIGVIWAIMRVLRY